MDRFDDDTLFAELRELRPTPRPEFTAELDERAAAGFPRRSSAVRDAMPFALLADRWRALSPAPPPDPGRSPWRSRRWWWRPWSSRSPSRARANSARSTLGMARRLGEASSRAPRAGSTAESEREPKKPAAAAKKRRKAPRNGNPPKPKSDDAAGARRAEAGPEIEAAKKRPSKRNRPRPNGAAAPSGGRGRAGPDAPPATATSNAPPTSSSAPSRARSRARRRRSTKRSMPPTASSSTPRSRAAAPGRPGPASSC